ncbi:UDP-N-acetylmuramate--L-alanine ligase [Bacteriovoracales bacterium]|nr:UDP-N-acetylmuramate--L-alanine ligase [Bacteriovoracales bacterium]
MFQVANKLRVHFVGIGGIGMSGIAEVLLSMGYKVSGSDLNDSSSLEKLRKLGADIYVGHVGENVEGATTVVYSSAISSSNPEIVCAKENNIPIMRRAEMLAELMRLKKGIAIAGTHGKTTTTSFLATILHESQLDPTYIIGGIVHNLNGHAKIGAGEFLVAEADESDGSFLLLNPVMSIITNIDNDHMDFYKNEKNLITAFKSFANRIPFYGVCAINGHDKNLMQIRKKLKKPSVTFGIGNEGETFDYEARDVRFSPQSLTCYDLWHKGEKKVTIEMSLPGRHNILNSLGAISLAHNLDVDFPLIARSIKKFNGVGRRLQKLYTKDSFEVLDDYAHHPTEISTTLKAVRETRADAEIVAVFEPHRYTRTQDCWDRFLHCFNYADKLYICPIYGASETAIEGINSERLVSDINRLHPGLGHILENKDGLLDLIESHKDKKATLISLGAGSIGKNIRDAVFQIGK